jgi:hypothetical protein
VAERTISEEIMFRRIIADELDSAIKNAQRDHPRVRRISANLFGVTCRKRCVRNAEHEIEFQERPNGLWAECRECEAERWKVGTCRHVVAALPLFFYYREAQREFNKAA